MHVLVSYNKSYDAVKRKMYLKNRCKTITISNGYLNVTPIF